jgi:carboxyl-terminal processing protease
MASKKTRGSLILVLGILIGVIVSLSVGVWAKHDESQQELPLDQLRNFVQIMNTIKKDYVKQLDDKELLKKATQGMVDNLDPHSEYLDAHAYKEMNMQTSGQFGGLGIEVQMHNGFVRVISPIDDTPAKKAGIKAGDLIIRIDGTSVKDLSLQKAVDKMRGKPGSKITLTVLRKGADHVLTFHITRQIIHVKSVKGRTLAPGYGYLRVSQFTDSTADNLKKQIKELKKDNDGKLKGVVLDLRNNPGGVLGAAVKVVDDFVNSGTIVSIKGRTPDSDKTFSAHQGDLLDGASMIVLVNGGSASAAEIVSGALQDDRRAVIAGTQTFGKGSVQTILPLKNGAAIKLTTARYYLPSGRTIQDQGITPNIALHPLKVSKESSGNAEPIKEVNLVNHLTNKVKTKKLSKEDQKALAKKKIKLAKKDFELYEALNLLQGLHIMEAQTKH